MSRPSRIASGHLPVAGAQRLLQALENGKIGANIIDLPLLAKCRGEPAEIACRIVHVRLGDLDIVEPDDRIEPDRRLSASLRTTCR